jgi:cytochrome c oxidase subunit 4
MNQNATEHIGHISSVKLYILIGVTLLILTGLTVKVSTIPLGPWNAIAALIFASAKALLVALFFMHLLYDKKIYAVVVSTALVMLGIMLALTMADVLRRGDIYQYQEKPIHPQAEIYNNVKADTTGTGTDSLPNKIMER